MTTPKLACTGTIIRAQGIASEAWYNGARDAEIDRMARQQAQIVDAWHRESKELTSLVSSLRREADRARRTSMDRLEQRVRKSRRQRRLRKLRDLPYLLKGTLIVWGLRLGILGIADDAEDAHGRR